MKLYNNIIILFLHGFFVLANFILIIIGPSYLVGQFLLQALAESCGGGYSGPLQLAGHGAAVWGAGGVNQGEHGGLCLAGLLASTPGPRPWSRDMRGNYQTCWHSLGELSLTTVNSMCRES